MVGPSKWAIETYVVYDSEILLVRWSKNEVDLTRIMTFVEKSAEIKVTTASLRSLSQLLATS